MIKLKNSDGTYSCICEAGLRSLIGCVASLITLYQILHDELHAKSGQVIGPLKLQYIQTEKECIMGWVSHI